MKIENGRVRPPAAPGTNNGMHNSVIHPGAWIAILIGLFLASCAAPDTRHHIVISTREQKLALLDGSTLMAIYPVSTSKFGLGDWRGSKYTPLGRLEIAEKIGD